MAMIPCSLESLTFSCYPVQVSNRNSVDQKIKKPRARGQGKIPGAVSTAAACRRGPHCLSSSDEEDGGKASQENWNLHAHTLSRVYKMSSTDEEHGQEVPRHTGYPQVLDFTMTSSSDDEAKEARLSSQCSKPNAKSACEKGVKSDSRGFVGVSSDDDDDEVEDMCNEPLVLPPWISLLSPMHVPVRCQPADRMWPAASARTNPEYGCSSPNEMDSPPGSKSKRRWEQHSPQNSAVDKEGRHPQSHALFVYGGAGGSATLGTSPGGDIPIAWPGNIWHAGLVSWLKGTGFILDTVEVSGSMQLAEVSF